MIDFLKKKLTDNLELLGYITSFEYYFSFGYPLCTGYWLVIKNHPVGFGWFCPV
jgi:hypothetical protein